MQTSVGQIEHLLQTAEAIRNDGKPEWMQVGAYLMIRHFIIIASVSSAFPFPYSLFSRVLFSRIQISLLIRSRLAL
jgi:hypothetical protein